MYSMNSLNALPLPCQVIGVEPTGANAMAISLARGERVALSRVDAFADGVAVKQVGAAEASLAAGRWCVCCVWRQQRNGGTGVAKHYRSKVSSTLRYVGRVL